MKVDLQQILDKYLRVQIQRRLGVFSEAPRQIVHEGKGMRTVRSDESVEESDLKAASAEMTIRLSDVPSLTLQKRAEQLDQMADEMARQISTHLFDSLNQTLEKSGQVVGSKSRPFDAESIFAALESIQLDFEEDGRHSPLSFVHPAGMSEKVQIAFQQLESDPILRARYEGLISKKKEEWRDREAARKLVG